MRIKIIISLMFLAVLSSSAQSTSYRLAVTTIDGQKQQIELNDYPTITMNGGRLEIKSKTITLGFDLQKVADFKYVNGSASVSAITSEPGVTRQGDRLIFRAENRDLKISVCDMGGIVVFSKEIHTGEESVFSLSQLSPGVYVVSVNNTSFKMTR